MQRLLSKLNIWLNVSFKTKASVYTNNTTCWKFSFFFLWFNKLSKGKVRWKVFFFIVKVQKSKQQVCLNTLLRSHILNVRQFIFKMHNWTEICFVKIHHIKWVLRNEKLFKKKNSRRFICRQTHRNRLWWQQISVFGRNSASWIRIHFE